MLLHNLDLDLSFIYRFCHEHLHTNMAVTGKFKSLREFYSLMLTNNIMDYLEPAKRSISYPNLPV